MTDVALKEHLESQIRALREHVDSQTAAGYRALDLATRALHDKFEQVNQFREQVLEERRVYVRHEVTHALSDRVKALEIAEANTLGRWWMVGVVASGLGAGIGLLLSRVLGLR